MKNKVEMTHDLINQLHKDGWLSKKLKQEYELNHIGDDFNYQDYYYLFYLPLFSSYMILAVYL